MNPRKKSESIYQKIIRYSRYPRIAIYAFIILWVIIIWANIPFPILNPSNTPKPYNWTFTYPPSPANTIYFTKPSESMYFQLTVSANQPFADGVAVRVDAIGSIGSVLKNSVRSVTVGFLGAYPYGMTNGYLSGIPLSGVTLWPSPTKPSDKAVFLFLVMATLLEMPVK